MANRIVSVHAGIYGMGIYVIMLPSSGFSVAHYTKVSFLSSYVWVFIKQMNCREVYIHLCPVYIQI